jgi:hypothetical protein
MIITFFHNSRFIFFPDIIDISVKVSNHSAKESSQYVNDAAKLSGNTVKETAKVSSHTIISSDCKSFRRNFMHHSDHTHRIICRLFL